MESCPLCGSNIDEGDSCEHCGEDLQTIPRDIPDRSEPFFMRYSNKLLGDWGDWNSQLLGFSGMAVGVYAYLVVLMLYPPRFGTATVVLVELSELFLFIALFGFVAAVLDDLYVRL